MSFPKEYNKDRFKQDLEKEITFTFRGKTWISVVIWLINIVLIASGVYYVVIVLSFNPIYSLLIGISYIVPIIAGIYSGIKSLRRMIKITPEGISWKGSLSSGFIYFIDVEDLSFFPSPLLNFHTVKLFLSNNVKIKLRTSNMMAPKNWYSEEMIRSIIDTYWTKVNPRSKYSTESVTSKPSTRPKSISLINPSAYIEQSEAFQGYKCPKCLFIHETEHKFCSKCGAEMK